MHVSERRACAALGQHRLTQRKVPFDRADEQRLTADIIETFAPLCGHGQPERDRWRGLSQFCFIQSYPPSMLPHPSMPGKAWIRVSEVRCDPVIRRPRDAELNLAREGELHSHGVR